MGTSVESLLEPISDESPCGEDVAFDPAFLELEQAFEGRPETQMGDAVNEGEEPDWADVRRRADELLVRSRDLRVMLHRCVASMLTEGVAGLEHGLGLMARSVDVLWAHVHPQLDPDDDDDPTERINILASLVSPPGQVGDPVQFRKRLAATPLVHSKVFGPISLRDVRRADAGEAGDGDGPDTATIQAAVMDAEIEDLVASRNHVRAAQAHLQDLDRVLTEKVGAGSAIDFGDVAGELGEALGVVGRWLDLRGYVEGAEVAAEAADGAAPADGAAAVTMAAAPAPPPGSINGPGDVLDAIGRICDYYRDREPSSPVPLVLDVARSLVSRSFLEISTVLTPEAVQMLQQVKGESSID